MEEEDEPSFPSEQQNNSPPKEERNEEQPSGLDNLEVEEEDREEAPKKRRPKDYEGKYIMVEDEEQLVPKFSKWKKVCRCGPCRVAYFPAIDKYFINQWECHPFYPIVVTSLLTISVVFGIWSIFETLEGSNAYIMFAFTLFLFTIWLISYYCAVCSSPGYLPFYWAVEKGDNFSYKQQMDGIVTTEEQFEFAAYNGRPERGSFSKQARRLVLKADHICKWIGNWVGLKNYRFFFIKLVWCFVYFLDWFALLILEFVHIGLHGWKTTVPLIGMLVCTLPMIGFFFFICTIFFRHIRYTVKNTTTLQQFKLKDRTDKHNYYDLGCWRNCISVFGPAKYCPIWFFPVPIPRETDGFHWETNREIPPDYQ